MPNKVQMQKLREKPETSIVARQCLFHKHESITPFILQSFFILTIKYYNSITIASLFSPTRTNFKKGMAASIYSETSQEGCMLEWRRDCSWWRVKPVLIWWWTKSNWTGTANRSDTSLSELTHPSNHCQIDPHVWRREKEGATLRSVWDS